MMSVMHDAMRRDFNRLRTALLEQPAPAGRRRVALADHVDFLMVFLDGHHHSEDDLLWPRVRAKDPLLGDLLDSMVDDHEQIVSRVSGVTTAAADYRASESEQVRRALFDAIDDLLEVLLPHLSREEAELMPLVSERLSVADWRAFEREARPPLPATTLAEYLNWFFDDLDEDRRRRVTDGLPLPLVLGCRAAFGPMYRRRARLRWGPGVS
jgi:hemerythrin-like domain-containing protein